MTFRTGLWGLLSGVTGTLLTRLNNPILQQTSHYIFVIDSLTVAHTSLNTRGNLTCPFVPVVNWSTKSVSFIINITPFSRSKDSRQLVK